MLQKIRSVRALVLACFVVAWTTMGVLAFAPIEEAAFEPVVKPFVPITYAASTNIDFSDSLSHYRTVTLTGNITFTSSNLSSGRDCTVVIVGDGSSRTLTFPAGWKSVGAAAPTSIAANKIAFLTLVSRTSADSGVVFSYAEEP